MGSSFQGLRIRLECRGYCLGFRVQAYIHRMLWAQICSYKDRSGRSTWHSCACTCRLGSWGSGNQGTLSSITSLTLRVQVPNNHILTQNLYYNYYYPKPKYQIIGYLDPLGKQLGKR